MVSTQYWVYHERQEALLCGQHALNNLVQANEFSADFLADVACELDQMELVFMSENNEGGVSSKEYLNRIAEGSGNVDESGNFSIEVLRSALMSRYKLELPNIGQQGILDMYDITALEGFICNRQSHWFAIRRINGKYWNLNSTNEKPELISHFRLAIEIEGLQNAGYSVFCVTDSLPPPCTNEYMLDRGLPQYWWKEEDLLKGTNVKRADDPWREAGHGRRLDAKLEQKNVSCEMPEKRSIYDLSEEEQIEAAIYASMATDAGGANLSNGLFLETFEHEILSMDIGDEPSRGAKVQIRLPDGKKLIRNFNEDNTVKTIYAFIAQSNGGRRFTLRAKFPPQDLYSSIDMSILSCGLSGETINVSWK